MSEKIDFSFCDQYHKCQGLHGDMLDVKQQLSDADDKRNQAKLDSREIKATLTNIEQHLAVSMERFKWHRVALWGLGSLIMILVGYMVTMSVTSFIRDAHQNEKLISIEKDVSYISKTLKGE